MLGHLRVVEVSSGIAASYCGRALADAGAQVTLIEPPDGHALRRWSSVVGGRPGLLFDFLVQGKRCIRQADPWDSPELAEADIVIEDATAATAAGTESGAAQRGQVVVSISPFGRNGPWRERPASEFTIQALCGSTGRRGFPGREPVYAGGELGEWAAGSYAAAAAVCFAQVQSPSGGRATRRPGVHVDVSVLEASSLVLQAYWSVDLQLRGSLPRTLRAPMIPSIEPSADGFVGFSTITAEQFQGFLCMVERPDLADDVSLLLPLNREQRRDELLAAIHQWTTQHTTAEIVELATALRIPVAPIGNGANLPTNDQFAQRGVYSPGPLGTTQPRIPYQITPYEEEEELSPPKIAAAHPGRALAEPRLPLEGLKVADFTAFWAGPSATHLLASLGAEVIKIESIQRPDGMRFTSAKPDDERFYEWGTVFHAINTNKRSVTLDLTEPEGVEIAGQLIAWADVVIENFSARVMEAFGLGPEEIRRRNPRAVLVRMPAFGLSGPWRNRTGFAMTVEQASGMAWRTGYEGGPPMDVGGICDPLGGMHAVIAALAALAERERSGRGALVEVPLVEVALVMTAEEVLAYSEDGTLITRTGNHGPGAAPQGCYPCRDDEWLAVSVLNDQQWAALRAVLGSPPWAQDPALDHAPGRHDHRDALDRRLGAWCEAQDANALEELLSAAGVPAARVVRPSDILTNPQLRQRGFFERLTHEVVGSFDVPSLPFRAGAAPHGWHATPAPTLGQHNAEVLGTMLGISEADQQKLRDKGIIGQRLARR